MAATLVYLVLNQLRPGGLTGGSVAGLWFGILGSLLMIYAGLLSALRKVPSWWWIGSRKVWLRGHIWLGLLSGWLIVLHSSFRWGGLLERLLWVVLILTLATGVFGLLLQQFVPRILTTRFPEEAPYEQIPHLCRMLRLKADEMFADLVLAGAGRADAPAETATWGGLDLARAQLFHVYETVVRRFLGETYLRRSPLAKPLGSEALFASFRSSPALAEFHERLDALSVLCEQRRQLGEQERLHHTLHGWLLVHIPLSVALLVLGLAHAVLSLYY